MLERPSHLKTRQITSPLSFSKDAIIIRQNPGHDDENNVWIPGDNVETPVRLVGAPIQFASNPKEEGRRLVGDYRFYISTQYDEDEPSPIPIKTDTDEREGDKINYEGFIYKIKNVNYWDGFCECLGKLDDPQT